MVTNDDVAGSGIGGRRLGEREGKVGVVVESKWDQGQTWMSL